MLIYAVSSAADEAEKQAAAEGLLDSVDIVLSVQDLQEFYYQVTRPSRPGRLSHEAAILFVEELSKRDVQTQTIELFRSATVISQCYQVSYWDAAIVAAAEAMGCDAVYSEDLNAGQEYASVTVINPFTSLRTEPAPPG